MADNEDYWVRHAIRMVKSTYGDVVSVDAKNKSLHKFGENLLVGTSVATIMTLPAGEVAETYVASNIITHVSSSDSGDDQVAAVEGHTISGSDLTFVTQNVTLNGQTKVALDTALARCSRVANSGASDFAGTIYVFEDGTLTAGVPDTAAQIHLTVPVGENRSQKAATSFSSVDYCFVTNIHASVNEKTATSANIRFRVRSIGGVFQTVFNSGIHSSGTDLNIHFRPFLIVPTNSDVIMTAEADGASKDIAAGFNSLLAAVQS